jgi:hypothetical protein
VCWRGVRRDYREWVEREVFDRFHRSGVCVYLKSLCGLIKGVYMIFYSYKMEMEMDLRLLTT